MTTDQVPLSSGSNPTGGDSRGVDYSGTAPTQEYNERLETTRPTGWLGVSILWLVGDTASVAANDPWMAVRKHVMATSSLICTMFTSETLSSHKTRNKKKNNVFCSVLLCSKMRLSGHLSTSWEWSSYSGIRLFLEQAIGRKQVILE